MDVVYVTLVPGFASFFAAAAPGGGLGDLYEVEPEEPMEPDLEAIDPSTTTCVNWRVPAATVVRVVERALALPHPAFRTENAMLAW